MNLLSRSEETILVTILKLGNDAYGVSIRTQIYEDTGDLWSFASIYQPLERLVKKKYVLRSEGGAAPVRSGKSRYYYSLTPSGKRALLEIRATQERIWKGVPKIVIERP